MPRRIAVVTGGAGDIGAEICRALELANYDVRSIDLAPCPRIKESYTCSVTDRDGLEDILSWIEVDVLVNAAGVTDDAFLHKMRRDQWDDVLDINLTGTFNACRLVVPGMRKRQYGRIVNISSVNGARGQIGQCNYAATKAGVHALTMSLAQEGAIKNVLVNTISPGYIDTQMTQKIPDAIRSEIIASIPTKTMGTPQDISRTVLFLCDEENTYITGANIQVNGGLFTSF